MLGCASTGTMSFQLCVLVTAAGIQRRDLGFIQESFRVRVARQERRAKGYTDRQVFHSIRATFITQLERAGVPEGTVQDLVGHQRSTLTGSTYSGKSTMAMRRDALAKLSY